MNIKIFAVRDSAVEAFLQPFFSPTKGAAIRSLTDATNDPKHDFNKNAKYFALYYLGDYDDSTGFVQLPDAGHPVFIVDCIELLNKD